MQPNSPTMLPELKRVKQEDFSVYDPAGRECVYLIQPVGGGLVKVGSTKNKPVLRLRAHQLCSPVPLRLVAIAEGVTEKKLHECFSRQRAYGEWFFAKGVVTDFMHNLANAPTVAFAKLERKTHWTARPEWARIITRRRRELELSQEEIAFFTRRGRGSSYPGSISQRTVSALESGQIIPTSLSANRFANYLSALSWNPSDFVEATGLEVSA